MSDNDRVPQPEFRPVKNHGFKWPWHIYQISSWVVSLVSLTILYVCIFPWYDEFERYILATLIGILYAVIFTLMIIATWINPTDPVVARSKELIDRNLRFEPQPDESFWMYWQAFSKTTSKHCGQCNRWVYHFDHHCKWLNNCIGDRNYKYFICLMVSFCIASFIILGISIQFVIAYHQQDSSSINEQNLKEFYGIEGRAKSYFDTYYAFNWILMGLTIVKILFSIHLLGFQVFIKWQGLTTYQYVLKQREKHKNKVSK